MRVLNSTQMRDADRRTIEEIGIPSLVLMENAGRQAVAAMEAVYTDLLDRQIAVLCGRGNNGGDGFVIARTLVQRGADVAVFLIGRVTDVRGDARINLEILGRLGVTVVEVADSQAWELHFSEVSDCTLIVDAIFGTGLRAPVSGLIQSVIADVNASGIPVVSIDLPSGLSADSSEPIGDCIDADLTITLAAPKLPLVLPPAEVRAGDIVIVAASGTSGAGRSASAALLATEVMGAASAYQVGGTHRHTPEIEQALAGVAAGAGTRQAAVDTARPAVSFTPMLAPMPRGILATCTARLTSAAATTPALRAALAGAYAGEPFVHVLPEGRWPTTATARPATSTSSWTSRAPSS